LIGHNFVVLFFRTWKMSKG